MSDYNNYVSIFQLCIIIRKYTGKCDCEGARIRKQTLLYLALGMWFSVIYTCTFQSCYYKPDIINHIQDATHVKIMLHANYSTQLPHHAYTHCHQPHPLQVQVEPQAHVSHTHCSYRLSNSKLGTV